MLEIYLCLEYTRLELVVRVTTSAKRELSAKHERLVNIVL